MWLPPLQPQSTGSPPAWGQPGPPSVPAVQGKGCHGALIYHLLSSRPALPAHHQGLLPTCVGHHSAPPSPRSPWQSITPVFLLLLLQLSLLWWWDVWGRALSQPRVAPCRVTGMLGLRCHPGPSNACDPQLPHPPFPSSVSPAGPGCPLHSIASHVIPSTPYPIASRCIVSHHIPPRPPASHPSPLPLLLHVAPRRASPASHRNLLQPPGSQLISLHPTASPRIPPHPTASPAAPFPWHRPTFPHSPPDHRCVPPLAQGWEENWVSHVTMEMLKQRRHNAALQKPVQRARAATLLP